MSVYTIPRYKMGFEKVCFDVLFILFRHRTCFAQRPLALYYDVLKYREFSSHLVTYVFPQQILVDARGHLLGRLASIVAKAILGGESVMLCCSDSCLYVHSSLS